MSIYNIANYYHDIDDLSISSSSAENIIYYLNECKCCERHQIDRPDCLYADKRTYICMYSLDETYDRNVLNTTGFMHNRSRLLTVSFLVKTLLIDWREGETYFATQLVDYVPVKNIYKWNECYQEYLNVSYGKPIVDYKTQRLKTLSMYKKVIS